MKKHTVLIITALAVICAGCGKKEDAPKESLTKRVVSSLTSTVTSTVKDTATGIKEGFEEGRKSASSTDGAIIINNKEEMLKALDITILSYEKDAEKENAYKVTLAFKNEQDVPVRFGTLPLGKNVVLIDTDGFATMLKGAPKEGVAITVLPRAATKLSYLFLDVSGTPKYFRLLDHDMRLPDLKK